MVWANNLCRGKKKANLAVPLIRLVVVCKCICSHLNMLGIKQTFKPHNVQLLLPCALLLVRSTALYLLLQLSVSSLSGLIFGIVRHVLCDRKACLLGIVRYVFFWDCQLCFLTSKSKNVRVKKTDVAIKLYAQKYSLYMWFINQVHHPLMNAMVEN